MCKSTASGSPEGHLYSNDTAASPCSDSLEAEGWKRGKQQGQHQLYDTLYFAISMLMKCQILNV